MLPKIIQKKATIPYHCFAKELLCHKQSENNFSKLKLIKEFLDDQESSFKFDRSVSQIKNSSDNSTSHQCPEQHRLKTIKKFYQKQNETKSKKIKRQSMTAETNMSQQLQKPKINNQKSIFCVPDRFQLNGFLQSGRIKKTVQIKDLLKPSLKVPNKVFTHRIL